MGRAYGPVLRDAALDPDADAQTQDRNVLHRRVSQAPRVLGVFFAFVSISGVSMSRCTASSPTSTLKTAAACRSRRARAPTSPPSWRSSAKWLEDHNTG